MKYLVFISLVFCFVVSGSEKVSEFTDPSKKLDETRLVRRIAFGVGTMESYFDGDETGSFTHKQSYVIGGNVEFGDKSPVVYEAGLYYRSMGGAVAADFHSYDDFSRPKLYLNYLTAPFNIKYYSKGQETDSTYVKAGLMYSQLLDKSLDRGYGSQSDLSTLGVRNFELAFDVGAGARLEFKNDNWVFIELCWIRGLTSVTDSQNTYNSGFYLMGGMTFDVWPIAL